MGKVLALTTLALLMMGTILTLPLPTLPRRMMRWRRLTSISPWQRKVLITLPQVLGKRGEGVVPPASKWQRLEEANDTILELQKLQVFDPSLDRKDKKEFRLEVVMGLVYIWSSPFGETCVRRRGQLCWGSIPNLIPWYHRNYYTHCSTEGGQSKGCFMQQTR